MTVAMEDYEYDCAMATGVEPRQLIKVRCGAWEHEPPSEFHVTVPLESAKTMYAGHKGGAEFTTVPTVMVLSSVYDE
jgi:hypothetical protein